MGDELAQLQHTVGSTAANSQLHDWQHVLLLLAVLLHDQLHLQVRGIPYEGCEQALSTLSN